VRRLRELGAEVVIHDPHVPPYQGDLQERLRGCDAAVLMVAHDKYRHLNPGELGVQVVVGWERGFGIRGGSSSDHPAGQRRAEGMIVTLGKGRSINSGGDPDDLNHITCL